MAVKKKKLVIASVLKPVDDTRMYEKFGLSLAQTNKYDVNIIGFSGNSEAAHSNISFHPIFTFSRKSLKRLLASFFYARKLLQVKPEVLIVTCPEILVVSVLFKILFGAKLCYDIQENTARNILWSSDKPSLLRWLMSKGVFLNERSLMKMIDQIYLAEKCYLNEYSFIKSKKVEIIENKAKKPLMNDPSLSEAGIIRLCFTGTLLVSYGLEDAITLVKKLQETHEHRLRLHIIGHSPRAEVTKRLQIAADQYYWIQLSISPTPIAHQEILNSLKSADFSIIAYRLNPSNANCFPTRIWEALAHQVPMVFKQEHPWCTLIDQYHCGLATDFSEPNLNLDKALAEGFYDKTLPDSMYWEYEANKLIKVLKNI